MAGEGSGVSVASDYRADRETKRLCQDASRAISAVLENRRRLTERDKAKLEAAREVVVRQAEHIVAVWD